MNGDIFAIADATKFVATIDAELEAITRANVERVRKGRLSDAEADYVIGLLRDVRADLMHAFTVVPWQTGDTIDRADPAVAWRDKVRWISAELEARERDYPELVRKGRLTEQEARTGIRVMTTLRRLYWRELFMWEPEPGPALDWLQAIRRNKFADINAVDARIPDGRRLKTELIRKHMAELELEDGESQGRLVA